MRRRPAGGGFRCGLVERGLRQQTRLGFGPSRAVVKVGDEPKNADAAARTDVGFLDWHLFFEMKWLSCPNPYSLEKRGRAPTHCIIFV